ncbi:hypothetical protein [Roseateles sp. MS654]|uniref:hypothetical protein n=1 Tax=Roseateles sp. MS654 TaxID=3412685 RepID=UPI003C2DB031
MLLDSGFLSSRFTRGALAGGVVLALAGGYLVSRSDDKVVLREASLQEAARTAPAPTSSVATTPAGSPVAAGMSGNVPGLSDSRPDEPFTPEQAGQSLHALFERIQKQQNVSEEEMEELRERLLTSIESNPQVGKEVEQFYHAMPAELGMERDMLRSMLVYSPAGREIVLQEANAIWEGKSERKFAEMYETYFNLPGQAPAEVIAKALGDLKAGAPADERTAVARLNFIGTLSEPGIPDAANYRSDAIQLLNQQAERQGSELVRALAVQKLYRLNSPGEAANIAVAQLSKGAYADLVRETASSISSGDVELTPTLRTALANAVKRPNASAEEKQQVRTVLGPQT